MEFGFNYTHLYKQLAAANQSRDQWYSSLRATVSNATVAVNALHIMTRDLNETQRDVRDVPAYLQTFELVIIRTSRVVCQY